MCLLNEIGFGAPFSDCLGSFTRTNHLIAISSGNSWTCLVCVHHAGINSGGQHLVWHRASKQFPDNLMT